MSGKRLAVVTGAARGIGRAIVLALLKEGRQVVGIDINAEQLAELENIVKDAGFSVVTKCLDITDTQALVETIESIVSEFGSLDILVNNAGITRDKLMMQMNEEDFDKVISVNLRAAFLATSTSVRSMVRNKFGRIVNKITRQAKLVLSE
jgi:3-oxoacyl-[acyl-carrier protein] reductase